MWIYHSLRRQRRTRQRRRWRGHLDLLSDPIFEKLSGFSDDRRGRIGGSGRGGGGNEWIPFLLVAFLNGVWETDGGGGGGGGGGDLIVKTSSLLPPFSSSSSRFSRRGTTQRKRPEDGGGGGGGAGTGIFLLDNLFEEANDKCRGGGGGGGGGAGTWIFLLDNNLFEGENDEFRGIWIFVLDHRFEKAIDDCGGDGN
ncbi:unnamed protein product [Linum trigynum]|uniref:Uncharacterized protein n=1 Tax=Linum trigynum TaxID=586398 RepID=A0AAV2E280_9ROSI